MFPRALSAAMDDRQKMIAIAAAAAAAVGVLAVGLYWGMSTAAPVEAEEAASSAAQRLAAKQRAVADDHAPAAAQDAATSVQHAGGSTSPSPAPSPASSGAARGSSDSGGGVITLPKLKEVLRYLRDQLLHMSQQFHEDMRRMEAEGSHPSEEFLSRAPVALHNLFNDLLTRYGLSPADLARAQADHGDDAEVVELAVVVQRLLVGDEGVRALERVAADVPPDMTADKFYPMYVRQVALVDEEFARVVERAREAPMANRRAYLEKLVVDMVPDVAARVQAELGLSDHIFHSCLLHFLQRDTRVVEVLHASQRRQEELRASLLRR